MGRHRVGRTIATLSLGQRQARQPAARRHTVHFDLDHVARHVIEILTLRVRSQGVDLMAASRATDTAAAISVARLAAMRSTPWLRTLKVNISITCRAT